MISDIETWELITFSSGVPGLHLQNKKNKEGFEMIFDDLLHCDIYKMLSLNFRTAFEFLQNTDFFIPSGWKTGY